jgi:hypothetical protein
MTKRKFYKTTFSWVVLSEEPLAADLSPEEIRHMTMEGDCSGDFERVSEKVLNGKQAAKALQEQASDPEFFQIDENGNDLKEDE